MKNSSFMAMTFLGVLFFFFEHMHGSASQHAGVIENSKDVSHFGRPKRLWKSRAALYFKTFTLAWNYTSDNR